jgi:hypothetical protein
MPVRVFINAAGIVVVATPQGEILRQGFFRTEEETVDVLEAMGYQQLLTAYPAAELVVGTGMEHEDLSEIFLEASPAQHTPRTAPSRPRRCAHDQG